MVIEALRRFFVTNDIGACRIVVACSGGVDSTALLVAMTELDFELVCAHVNHHLRGDESNEDEAFVRAMCEQFEIAIEVDDGTLSDADMKRAGIEADLANPFSAGAKWLPMFALRKLLIKPINKTWGLRWYRHCHAADWVESGPELGSPAARTANVTRWSAVGPDIRRGSTVPPRGRACGCSVEHG